jgi:excinuclease UvrABC ATPase subunit
MSPIVSNKKGTFKDTFEKLQKDGYIRVRVDGEIRMLEDDIELEKNKRHDIDVVVDRIVKTEESRSRIHDSIETALNLSEGRVKVLAEYKRNYSLLCMHVQSAASPCLSWSQDCSPSMHRSVPAMYAMA